MKNISERDESIKAWETFIQSLRVETLLDSYVECHPAPDYMSVTNFDDGNEIGFQTYGDYMTILCGGVWYVFSTPLELWDIPINMSVDRELGRMLDFEVVRDLIRAIEL